MEVRGQVSSPKLTSTQTSLASNLQPPTSNLTSTSNLRPLTSTSTTSRFPTIAITSLRPDRPTFPSCPPRPRPPRRRAATRPRVRSISSRAVSARRDVGHGRRDPCGRDRMARRRARSSGDGVEVDLHVGVREDDRADVAALHHDAAVRCRSDAAGRRARRARAADARPPQPRDRCRACGSRGSHRLHRSSRASASPSMCDRSASAATACSSSSGMPARAPSSRSRDTSRRCPRAGTPARPQRPGDGSFTGAGRTVDGNDERHRHVIYHPQSTTSTTEGRLKSALQHMSTTLVRIFRPLRVLLRVRS